MVHALERAFLREGKAGKRDAIRRLGHFHHDGGRVGRRDFGRTQRRILREHFVVDLGDEEVLASRVLAPDLSELNGFHGHWFVLGVQNQTNGRMESRQWIGLCRMSLVLGRWLVVDGRFLPDAVSGLRG